VKKILSTLALAFVLTGCATDKGLTTLKPVEAIDKSQIVILNDGPTRESVLPVLTKWFTDNGYSSTVIHSLQQANPDNYVLSYRAWWSWDMATYMRKVEMSVNKQGESLGKLEFDALQYGGFGKFGNAEQRLIIMLDALFGKISLEEANKRLGDA
jgi:hypothetical protein